MKGDSLLITSNYDKPSSDKFYFSSAIIHLKKNEFIAKDTEIKIHKNIFDNSKNDPRLFGVSSTKKGNITRINKGIFTSCEESEDCPPWAIQASEIIHDKDKKQLVYKNAILRIYDMPVLYFPKFFHPDPSVDRQSSLQPRINKSNILGIVLHLHIILPFLKVKILLLINFLIVVLIHFKENTARKFKLIFKNRF